MQRVKSITPFRDVLFDIRNGLSLQEFEKLKDCSRCKLPDWKWRNLPNGEILQNRNTLFTALEESGALAPDNLSFLRSFLEQLKRDDLVALVDNLQENTKGSRLKQQIPKYAVLRDDVIDSLRKYEYLKLKEFCNNKMSRDDWEDVEYYIADGSDAASEKDCLFVALEKTNNLGTHNLTFLSHGLEEIGRTDLAWKIKELQTKTRRYSAFNCKLLSAVCFGALLAIFAFYQVMFPGLTSLRTWWCCYGAVQPLRVVEFDFKDYDRPHIRGVEFEWMVLKAKLHLDYERHPSLDMHYYLNLDRCGAGGVRHVRNVLFNLPQVRGAEVFAVNNNCTAAYFQHDNKWERYKNATKIVCPHSVSKEETKYSSRLELLLDDKIDLPPTGLNQPKSATLYNAIVEGLQNDELLKLKGLSKNKVREADRKEHNLASDKFTFLIDSMDEIGRKNLAMKLKELEKTPVNFSVFDWRLMLLVGVVLAIIFYQVMFPGLTHFRAWCCCYGAIKPIRMVEFDYTTFTCQTPHVRGVEFVWTALKKKLHLNFEKHPEKELHYYINLDRYGAGGVRQVRNFFFNLPQVGGPEVFAVNKECTEVYYELESKWHKYNSARNIICPHSAHANRIQSKEQSKT